MDVTAHAQHRVAYSLDLTSVSNRYWLRMESIRNCTISFQVCPSHYLCHPSCPLCLTVTQF